MWTYNNDGNKIHHLAGDPDDENNIEKVILIVNGVDYKNR